MVRNLADHFWRQRAARDLPRMRSGENACRDLLGHICRQSTHPYANQPAAASHSAWSKSECGMVQTARTSRYTVAAGIRHSMEVGAGYSHAHLLVRHRKTYTKRGLRLFLPGRRTGRRRGGRKGSHRKNESNGPSSIRPCRVARACRKARWRSGGPAGMRGRCRSSCAIRGGWG